MGCASCGAVRLSLFEASRAPPTRPRPITHGTQKSHVYVSGKRVSVTAASVAKYG